MKKPLIKNIACLMMISFCLFGCNKKKEEPITSDQESTIIKNAKSTDEYINKSDYKSIAYSFIYNIKSGLTSYESETNGTIKAKVLFFDYNIKYNSVLFKNNNTFYSKDDSKSTLMNVQNEFYMVDNTKILVSRDLKKYSVYTLEDYHKTSYSFDQYLVMGYVFNDESILNAELLSNNEDVEIKYTLDNDLATNWVKVDLKTNGGLSSYPEFKTIEMTLKMKKDFTPISYAIHAVYNVSKPILGNSVVTQDGKCVFSKINETITIPNESALVEKMGLQPSEINNNTEEENVKNDLMNSLSGLDWKNGVDFNGALTLNLLGNEAKLNIGANIAFDTSRLADDKIFSILNFYGILEGDESFNTLLSLVSTFAGDSMGEYASLLEEFKSLKIIYDGRGGLYLIPTNQNDIQTIILKIKLTDILDIALKQINVYNLITGANSDLLSFKKVEGKDKNNYKVEVSFNQETIDSIKDRINKVFEDNKYSMLKMLLSYKDFASIIINIEVVDGVFNKLTASLNYTKDDDSVVSLVELNLEASNKEFNFADEISFANDLYESYESVLELKDHLNELLNNVYVNHKYLSNLNEAYAEYKALSNQQKIFFKGNIETNIQTTIKQVSDILLFLETYYKYDLNNLTNEDILELAKAYKLNSLNSKLLSEEIGQDKYIIVSDLSDYVDYSSFDYALAKIDGDDENSWGLSEKEIRDIKLIFDISEYESSVSTQLWLKLLLAGKSIEVSDIQVKINNLYNNL